jgi:hypothetical protein
MSIPGFTAESALLHNSGHYRLQSHVSLTAGAVQPALPACRYGDKSCFAQCVTNCWKWDNAFNCYSMCSEICGCE